MMWQIWFLLFSIFFLFATIGIMMWNKNKKAFRADILEERTDGSLIVLYENVRLRVVKGIDGAPPKWKIMGSNDPAFEPMDKSYLMPSIKKKRDKIYIVRDKDGFMHPMKAMYDDEKRQHVLVPNYRNVLRWMYGEIEEMFKVKEKASKWKELLPYAVIFGSFVFVFLTFFFGWQYMEKRQTAIDASIQSFDLEVQQAKAMFDPYVLTRAAGIVQTYNTNQQTANWTQSNVFLNNPASAAIGVTGS